MATKAPTVLERRQARTRAAIIAAAAQLFETRGYDATTVADIAEAAEIGKRTFFSYFASKEEVLFPDVDARVLAAIDVINARIATDRPTDVLLRALRAVIDAGPALAGVNTGDVRIRLVLSHPSVRGRALQVQLDAQREIASHLAQAFPDDLDEVTAGAVVGAFVGAVTGAIYAIVDTRTPTDPKARSTAIRRAAEIALRPWQIQV